MNTLLLIIVGIPILEVLVMIKIGQNIGALNTILVIILTAIVGVYYAKMEGINTIRSGIKNLYKNKVPIYEMISGASIAIAAMLLIVPGFITDALGFSLLFPFSRKFLINIWLKNKNVSQQSENNQEIIDAEIIEKDKDKDET